MRLENSLPEKTMGLHDNEHCPRGTAASGPPFLALSRTGEHGNHPNEGLSSGCSDFDPPRGRAGGTGCSTPRSDLDNRYYWHNSYWFRLC